MARASRAGRSNGRTDLHCAHTHLGNSRAGWLAWYALAADEGVPGRVLVASVGFHGPLQEGEVEVGHSELPQFQSRGYAGEMVGALTAWALAQPSVLRVVAETECANYASLRVLAKVGFVVCGPGQEPGWTRLELGRSSRDT